MSKKRHKKTFDKFPDGLLEYIDLSLPPTNLTNEDFIQLAKAVHSDRF